ncbi:hypothetical protein GCM10009092_17760 [Bowmanella denitrificans]|uniref:Type II secretion system protein K n=1 Tax=Bowmanella denitrificans TaxID=366582 RepID=A0ABN0X323_9ALTE
MIHRKSEGIALIQALLVTMLIAVMALSLSYGARERVAVAGAFQDRLQAELLWRTTQTQVLEGFFRHDLTRLSGMQLYGARWNFWGQPFVLESGAQVTIQAVTGLVSLNGGSDDLLQSVLTGAGASNAQAETVIKSLADWVDSDDVQRFNGAEASLYQQYNFKKPRNGAIQDVSEFRVINGMNDELFTQIKDLLTIYPTYEVNPLYAPRAVINHIIAADVVDEVLRRRQSGLSESDWRQLLGQKQAVSVSLYPGNTFEVSIQVTLGDVILRKGFVLELQKNNPSHPMLVLSKY